MRSRSPVKLPGLAISLLAMSSAAHANDATTTDPDVPDKSGYTLLNPTPDGEMRKFTPDRPAKGFSVRTIDAGHFEFEMDTFNYTYSKNLGVATRSVQTLDPNFKVGITNWADVEVQFNGLQASRSFDAPSGALVESGAGFGDVVLRTKMNLLGNDGGPLGFALIPYVKLPSSSAPVISNGAVEGGLIAPLALRLPQDYLVTLMTEVDAVKDPKTTGKPTSPILSVSVTRSLVSKAPTPPSNFSRLWAATGRRRRSTRWTSA